MKNWKWGRIFLILLILSIIFSFVSYYFSNKVYADTTGWVDASIDSKDTQKIIENLGKAKDGMIKWQATSGNAYLLYGDPSSDLTEVNNNLDTYIARAQELQTLDKTSKEYQDGLTDLNDSLSGFYLYADEHWLRHNGIFWFILTNIIDWAAAFAFVVMIAYYFVNKPKRSAEQTPVAS